MYVERASTAQRTHDAGGLLPDAPVLVQAALAEAVAARERGRAEHGRQADAAAAHQRRHLRVEHRTATLRLFYLVYRSDERRAAIQQVAFRIPHLH